jgi:hypothetical protein
MIEIGRVVAECEHRKRRQRVSRLASLWIRLMNNSEELKPTTGTTVLVAVWCRAMLVRIMKACLLWPSEFLRKAHGADRRRHAHDGKCPSHQYAGASEQSVSHAISHGPHCCISITFRQLACSGRSTRLSAVAPGTPSSTPTASVCYGNFTSR